ncbi:AMP-binding protein [Paenibacillus xylaniclasticus]|uniref:AMP-binding protein n=1 Tax=Paenibacillus xylaniclasticus TaxID=588083 RepID=UPI0013DFA7C1|nr:MULTISPECIES: AMP-binding protein [Paenibacillus]GFN30748.1 hypothetical protein PCURB6_10080 [Paenibacillus curdlanolyticus]
MPLHLSEGLTLYDRLLNLSDPARIALKGKYALSYAELEEAIETRRLYLEREGVKKGSLVALRVSNSFTYIFLLYAIWKQGAQAMLIDPRLKPAEASALLDAYQPNYYVFSASQSVTTAVFQEEVDVEIKEYCAETVHRPEQVLVLFTSGSTGLPKAIGRTVEDLVWDMLKLTNEPLLSADDRVLGLTPLSHTYGLLNAMLQTLLVGATLHFAPSNQSRHILHTLREERITVMYGVPFHYRLLADAIDEEPLPCLKHAISAGEALDMQVHERFYAKYGVSIGQQYGMSETGVLSMDWNGRSPESVGEVLPGVQLSIIEGEIRVKLAASPYIGDQGSDRYVDGWFRTNDAGSIDASNRVSVHGRIDTMVSIGGLKVNMMEVEAVIKQHPGVLDVLVCSSDDKYGLEAYVQQNDVISELVLRDWCRERMADYKVPRSFYYVQEIPHTSTGKIDRSPDARLKLREQWLTDALLQQPEHAGLLIQLAGVLERRERWLEANDLYLRAMRAASNEQERMQAEAGVQRMRELLVARPPSLMECAKSLNKVVSVYCYGRSGTHLVKSLLDEHPDIILTMLDGTRIFELWNERVNRNDGPFDVDALIDSIFETFKELFNEGQVYEEPKMNGMCSLGENRDELYTLDREQFKQYFSQIVAAGDKPDMKLFYQAVQLSAAYSLGRTYDWLEGIPTIVEGGIHFGTRVEETKRLIELFPKTLLLHVVRNPVIAFASALKFQLASGQANLYNLSFQLVSLFQPVPAEVEWTSRTAVMKLEDLHTKPQATLELLCAMLGIRWHDSLLHSTFGGKKWWNTLTSALVSGFNTKTISNSYDELLSSFDKFRLESMLRVKYQVWGYDSHDYDNDEQLMEMLKLPFKFESLWSNDEKERASNRAMIHRLLTKLLREERTRDTEGRPDYEVRLLSPGGGR